jgi:hypothetical protein
MLATTGDVKEGREGRSTFGRKLQPRSERRADMVDGGRRFVLRSVA